MPDTIEAYPLHWPDGWPRTNPNQRESDRRFGGGKLTMGRAVNQLVNELRLLGTTNIIVSSNIPTKSDGLPYADNRRIDDPGIAVYFDFKKKHRVMARDGFTSPAGNIRSLTLAIEAVRDIRHTARDGCDRACRPSSTDRNNRAGSSVAAGLSESRATGSPCSGCTSDRSQSRAGSPCAYYHPAWPAGGLARSAPTPHRSGRLDSAGSCGHSGHDFRSSTSAAAPPESGHHS